MLVRRTLIESTRDTRSQVFYSGVREERTPRVRGALYSGRETLAAQTVRADVPTKFPIPTYSPSTTKTPVSPKRTERPVAVIQSSVCAP